MLFRPRHKMWIITSEIACVCVWSDWVCSVYQIKTMKFVFPGSIDKKNLQRTSRLCSSNCLCVTFIQYLAINWESAEVAVDERRRIVKNYLGSSLYTPFTVPIFFHVSIPPRLSAYLVFMCVYFWSPHELILVLGYLSVCIFSWYSIFTTQVRHLSEVLHSIGFDDS